MAKRKTPAELRAMQQAALEYIEQQQRGEAPPPAYQAWSTPPCRPVDPRAKSLSAGAAEQGEKRGAKSVEGDE